MPSIASISIDAQAPEGQSYVLTIEVGAPYPHPRHRAWACDLSLSPLYDDLMPAVGQDPLQALCLALRMAASLLEGFLQRGGTLSIEGERFPIEAYFDPPFTGLSVYSEQSAERG